MTGHLLFMLFIDFTTLTFSSDSVSTSNIYFRYLAKIYATKIHGIDRSALNFTVVYGLSSTLVLSHCKTAETFISKQS